MKKLLEIKKLEIQDAFIVKGNRHLDNRGYFEEIYNQTHLEKPITDSWKQVSISYSQQDVLRGMHCSNYAKFVQCLKGEVYDVIVDLRPDSPTFMKWQGVWLNGDSTDQTHLYVPKRCGHGFFAKKDCYFLYLQDGVYDPTSDVELNLFDKKINIEWPTPTKEYIISQKDSNNPLFEQLRARLMTLNAEKQLALTQPKFLVYGSTGFLGSHAIQVLKKQGKYFKVGLSRLENRESLEKEIKSSMPCHVLCLAGIAGKPNISWCEKNQIETIRANLIGQLNIADITSKLDINCTLLTSGAIYKYDDEHELNSNKGFTEEDEPNFNGNFYSRMRIIEEQLLKSYPNVLNLRITYPTSFDLDPRSLLAKLIKYEKIESIPISVTIIEDLWPIMIDMTEKRISGTYNFNNPGTISHDEILNIYKSTINAEHTWKLASPNKNVSASELSAEKLLNLGYKVPHVKESFQNLVNKIKAEKMFKPKNILLTGGAGFIGSHVALHLIKKYKDYNIVVLDILDQCANIKNLDEVRDEPNFRFVKGDICDFELVKKVMVENNIDCVFHFAALSHVDLSIKDFLRYTEVNVKGTHVLLENAYQCRIKRFVHVSTDEVYGTTGEVARADQALDPTNPYACSKLAAECIVMAYQKCFKLPVVISRSNNVYGPHQFLEKVIPKFINRLVKNQKCCIHGDGSHERDFLYASDAVNAFDLILHKGELNQYYNIGSSSVVKVIDLARMIIRIMNKTEVGREDEMIEYVEQRMIDDVRYRIECSPIKQLGWSQKVSFEQGLKETVDWYVKNQDYWINCDSALAPHPTDN